jgi:hypothetical protein
MGPLLGPIMEPIMGPILGHIMDPVMGPQWGPTRPNRNLIRQSGFLHDPSGGQFDHIGAQICKCGTHEPILGPINGAIIGPILGSIVGP